MFRIALVLATMLALVIAVPFAAAHCDTVAGPVIADARLALEKGDITPVLKWIRPADEPELRALFTKTLAVRSTGEAAREIADRYFFETLVRIHRAGEGAPFTGLKDEPLDPPIALADEALQSGSPEGLVKEVTADLTAGLRQRFAAAAEARKHANDSVAAGREYVARYVELMHYIERLHAAGAREHAESAAAHAD